MRPSGGRKGAHTKLTKILVQGRWQLWVTIYGHARARGVTPLWVTIVSYTRARGTLAAVVFAPGHSGWQSSATPRAGSPQYRHWPTHNRCGRDRTVTQLPRVGVRSKYWEQDGGRSAGVLMYWQSDVITYLLLPPILGASFVRDSSEPGQKLRVTHQEHCGLFTIKQRYSKPYHTMCMLQHAATRHKSFRRWIHY